MKLDNILLSINNNHKYENDKYNINQLIHKANIITICFGEEELVKAKKTDDLDLNYLKDYINKYDILLSKLKKISKAKIYVIGYYENRFIDKTKVIISNSELANITRKYGIVFINVSDLLLDNNYFLDNNKQYFNYKGHKKIADMIVNSL